MGMTATTTPLARAEPVASYATIDGALRAATHLVELQFEPAEVAVSPRAFHVVDRDRLVRRLARGVRRGMVLGVITVAGVWLLWTIGITSLVGTLAPIAIVAAIAGALIGAVVAVVQYRRARVMTWGIRRPELEPTAFDVVVRGDAAEANHELARWWDPASPPARWRPSA
jgi:hypothetical protein